MAGADERRTRQDLYLEISRELTDEEVSDIRGYIGGKQLPTGSIQRATAQEMFNMLERKRILKKGDLSFLVKLMESIDRQEFAEAANEIAEQESEGKSPEKEVTLTMESTPDPGPVQVFLSYQWDHQKQVIQLRDVLEKKGYSCWMDITKMGGGDKLHAEIDRGIRQAKVVISCVTPNYTKSDSCQNEVELAYRLKKPLVPVLLEKTAWPPEGPMAMPFAQLLYIDFTKESKEHPWKGAKLNDLITSLEQRLKE
ncbi:uncharacterized protein LOC118426726 isoform X1 [Branchiostoma floridae]|uniref:Uncharacterized protein LOC118426726 isoform X1 n=1 Tax=Branchiostoma floridae TaxID=7739 RepID=A0A9J7N6Z2_BRAFL|nr:uncharacterized protein LOC118426726 isoform X1 [Branchiostoma floridae]